MSREPKKPLGKTAISNRRMAAYIEFCETFEAAMDKWKAVAVGQDARHSVLLASYLRHWVYGLFAEATSEEAATADFLHWLDPKQGKAWIPDD